MRFAHYINKVLSVFAASSLCLPALAGQVVDVKPGKQYTAEPESAIVSMDGSTGSTVEFVKTAPQKGVLVAQQEVYPEAKLRQIYFEEVEQIKQTEDKERKARIDLEKYEKRKLEAQQEVEAKKYKIQSYQLKSQKAESEAANMKTELEDVVAQHSSVQEELNLVEKQSQDIMFKSDKVKKELSENKRNLETTLGRLQSKKEFLAKYINRTRIESQGLRSSVAVLQARVDSVESDVAELQAEEMKARTEWLAYKQQIGDLMAEKNESLETLAEAKKKYSQAMNDLRLVRDELNKADRERIQATQRVKAEVEAMDRQIASANRAKTIAEADIIRAEAETDKLAAYVARVRESKDKSMQELQDTEFAVMQSKLNLEKTKTDLTLEVASKESGYYREKRKDATFRGLASAEQASDIMDGGRTWVPTKACKIYRRPASDSQEVGMARPGQPLTGAVAPGGWIKILNGSDDPNYVDTSCGKFGSR